MDNLAVIAGSSGFIGRHLAYHLAKSGMKVIGLDCQPFDLTGVKTQVVDLTRREAVLDALSSLRPRWVFNLTGNIDHTSRWPDQREVMDQHWLSMLNLVEALDDVRPEAFINIGTSDEYGDQPAPQKETMREKPVAPYSAAKVAATHYLQMWHRQTGFPAIVARFFLVYGPGQDAQRLIPWTCTTLLRGEKMPASPGLQKRDFLYVQDAIEALVALASSPETRGKVFNVASGQPVMLRQILETVRETIGLGEIDFGARTMREGEIMELYADITHIQSVTGWRPSVGLSDGIVRTVEFYRSRQAA